jgi:hypothetical protein
MSSARSFSVASRVFDAFERFLRIEAISGIVLPTAAVAALLWANSLFADHYQDFWHPPLTFGAGAWVVTKLMFENLRRTMTAAGGSLEDIARVTVFVAVPEAVCNVMRPHGLASDMPAQLEHRMNI